MRYIRLQVIATIFDRAIRDEVGKVVKSSRTNRTCIQRQNDQKALVVPQINAGVLWITMKCTSGKNK
jgi:hypothetical protein